VPKKKTFLSVGEFQGATDRYKISSMAILHQKREAIFTRKKEPTCSSSCGRKQSDVFGAILLHWSCRHFIFFFPSFIWYKESYRATLGKTKK